MNLSSDYILLSFFNRLRKSAGMELDMTQYYLFLDLFMKGYGRDKASLKTLCKTLWLTKAKHLDAFERWFEEEFVELEKKIVAVTEAEKKGPAVSDSTFHKPYRPTSKKERDKQVNENKDNYTTTDDFIPESPIDFMEVVLNFKEGSGNIKFDNKNATSASEKNSFFIFSDEKHFPISERKFGHLMQRLHLNQSFRPSNVLDLPKISEQYCKNRFISNFQWIPISSSVQNIILLTDHEGSMSAFGEWGDFLYQSFEKSPIIGRNERYYFHDRLPLVNNENGIHTYKVFTNVNHTASINLEELLLRANDNSTWLIIFSDGGAYEENMNTEDLEHWLKCLQYVQKHVSAITWLNPLPENRWETKLAGYLSFFIKMVPFNLEGMKKAIKWANNAI